jgi:hypothetical protein
MVYRSCIDKWREILINKQELRIVVNTKHGATKEATESLIAQLHSQGKLTTPRHENWKIRHENEI